jgi:hypothetical protein
MPSLGQISEWYLAIAGTLLYSFPWSLLKLLVKGAWSRIRISRRRSNRPCQFAFALDRLSSATSRPSSPPPDSLESSRSKAPRRVLPLRGRMVANRVSPRGGTQRAPRRKRCRAPVPKLRFRWNATCGRVRRVLTERCTPPWASKATMRAHGQRPMRRGVAEHACRHRACQSVHAHSGVGPYLNNFL